MLKIFLIQISFEIIALLVKLHELIMNKYSHLYKKKVLCTYIKVKSILVNIYDTTIRLNFNKWKRINLKL